MSLPIFEHPWLFVLLAIAPSIACSLIDKFSSVKVANAELPEWCRKCYEALLPVFVGVVGLLIATLLVFLMDQHQNQVVADLAHKYAFWFVGFWDLSFSLLSLFCFAMFYDAFRVSQSNESEFVRKNLPDLAFQLVPAVLCALLTSSCLTGIVIAVGEGFSKIH